MKLFSKLLKAYVLVGKGKDENTRHVSVLLELPVGGNVVKEMDLEMDDQDVESAVKIIKQINDSDLGKQIQILTKVE